MKATNSVGILREVKNKWERRVSITPTEVKKLVDRNIRVLIEPCERRVFKDIEYKNAGAIVTNDLSPSSFIIGVKDIPSHKLFANHSYLNFAHVIKGQPQNMPFLDQCFAQNIRLFDYECIKDPTTKLRTVAFGRFAGLAGMVTGMRGLGEHLLAQGCATPFLNISSTYMYNSLHDAQQQMMKVGELIEKYGLPSKYGPFVFTFTGGGNVTNGALEIFKLLPHEFISAEDLPKLEKNYSPHKVYGVRCRTQDIVHHKQQQSNFEEKHYFEYPEEYEPVFHRKIAPYTSVLVNGMYWDHRYPRLLTIEQMKQLHVMRPQSMLALFDISCDPEGAVEFLKKTTNTDQPFFTYHVDSDEAMDAIDGDGVLVLGVDSLPAELPRDSSEYFSKCLYPFLERLATSDSNVSLEKQAEHLGPEMHNAMITWNGELTQNFKYIQALRREHSSKFTDSDNLKSDILKIDGHLFDSGIINQILDLIEAHNAEYTILNLDSKVNTRELQKASRLVLQVDLIESEGGITLEELRNKLQTLCELHPKANAKLIKLPFGAKHARKAVHIHEPPVMQQIATTETESKVLASKRGAAKKQNMIANQRDEQHKPSRHILIFGSGFVSKPVIDYLSMSGNNYLTIASNEPEAATALSNRYCTVLEFDVTRDEIDPLVSQHDIVVSLLPANMHIPVAKSCVKFGKDLATASYISDEMRQLNQAAVKSKILMLNECGLDPGLDHMSAVKIIHDIQERNAAVKSERDREVITGFASYCGGLPAPESANNAFGYKFSWSPIGVLRASSNDAVYMVDGNVKRVNGEQLLVDGIGRYPLEKRSNPYPSLNLEHLANRDSMKYIDKYQLNKHDIQNMYRGTLRYNGFSDMLYGCRVLGLLGNKHPFKAKKGERWYDFVRRLIDHHILNHSYKNAPVRTHYDDSEFEEKGQDPLQYLIEDILMKNTPWNSEQIALFLQCLDNDLNIFQHKNGGGECIQHDHELCINAFCELLESKLCFDGIDERDMVLLINRISTNHNKIYESSLLVYGDEVYSAMARTVGFPLAVATQFLLNGDISKESFHHQNIGILDATHPSIANKVLEKCQDHGIMFKSRIIAANYEKYKMH